MRAMTGNHMAMLEMMRHSKLSAPSLEHLTLKLMRQTCRLSQAIRFLILIVLMKIVQSEAKLLQSVCIAELWPCILDKHFVRKKESRQWQRSYRPFPCCNEACGLAR